MRVKQVKSLCVILGILFIIQFSSYSQIGDGTLGSRIDWSPDGTMLAVGKEKMVQIVDSSSNQILNTLPTFDNFINEVQWNPDGSHLAIVNGFEIQIWDQPWHPNNATNSLIIQNPTDPLLSGVTSIHWNPDTGNNQIAGTITPNVLVWDTTTGQIIQTLSPTVGTYLVSRWDPDGLKLAIGDVTGRITVYNFGTNQYDGSVDVFDNYAVTALEWNSDGTQLVAGTGSGYIQFLQLDPMLRKDGTSDQFQSGIVSLKWNPTVSYFLASGYMDGSLVIWNLSKREQEIVLSHSNSMNSIDWSPDGQFLAYRDNNNMLTVPAPTTPFADAGDNQISSATIVSLDGSGSYDPDGIITTYSWSIDGIEIANGISPQVELNTGDHVVTLQVMDNDGATATDEVVITVEP